MTVRYARDIMDTQIILLYLNEADISMHMEAIKISPKKNGRGYTSGYSISIASKELNACGFYGKRIIKIIDEANEQIIIKAKRYSLTRDVIDKVIELKRAADTEAEQIDRIYFSDRKAMIPSEMLNWFEDEHSGKIERAAKRKFIEYLMNLSLEEVADLMLLMYLGRDFDANTHVPSGEERFLEFYDRYGDIVQGKTKDILIDTLYEKTPLVMYLRTGLRILDLPIGASLDTILHNWNE